MFAFSVDLVQAMILCMPQQQENWRHYFVKQKQHWFTEGETLVSWAFLPMKF